MYESVGALLPYLPDYAQAAQASIETTDTGAKLANTKDAFIEDIRGATAANKAKGGLAVFAAFWEWGPANEITAAMPSIATLQATGNPLYAGIVGGAIYASQQIGFGLATSAGIDAIPKTEHVIREEFNTAQPKGASYFDRATLLLGLGASAVVINEHIRDDEQTFKKDARLLGKLALPLMLIDMAVFTGANAAIDNADAVNIDPNTLIDIATNPWTYVGIFATAKVVEYYDKHSPEDSLYKRIKSKIARKATAHS